MATPCTRAQRRARLGAVLLLGIILGACGSSDPSGPAPGTNPPVQPPPAPPPPPVDTHPALTCGLPSHPCAFSDVPIAVLQRMDTLRTQALARWTGSDAAADVAAWLDAQTDVAEVQADRHAVRFRVDGGRAIWLMDEAAVATRGGAAAATRTTYRSARHRPIVRPGQEQKRALVVSPYLWDFGDGDDGGAVAGILAETRGYAGRVRFDSNPTMEDTRAGLGSFAGWRDFDVIHVSSHGRRLCDDDGTCHGAIAVGLLDNFLPPGPGDRASKIQSITEPGLELFTSTTTGRDHLYVTADYFRNRYPGGLENTFVFLNACQSQGPGSSDLVDAIRGTTSVVLGWTEAVSTDDALAAATALYDHLGSGGYPARAAHEMLGALTTGVPYEDDPAPELRLAGRTAGGDLRIREIVTLLHPSSDQALRPADLIGIDGVARDGKPDAAPYRVRIDGVLPEEAAAMMVRVVVDGIAAEPVAVSAGTADDGDRWTIAGAVALPYDLEDDRPVTYRGTVSLQGGGESQEERGAVLSGAEPLMGWEWELTATSTSFWAAGVPHTPYGATTKLTLSFAEGQSPQDPMPRYIVTAGSVTWDYNHTYYNCTYSTPVITFDVDPAIAGVSSLRFDPSGDPATYTGYIYTRGPTVSVFERCEGEGSTRSHVAQNIWVDVQSSAMPVQGDTLITGVHEVSGGGLTTRSTYTIRRVR